MKLIRRVGDGMTMLVEHPENGQHRTVCSNLDEPAEFRSATGSWIPESDPRAEVFLLKALDRSQGRREEASRQVTPMSGA